MPGEREPIDPGDPSEDAIPAVQGAVPLDQLVPDEEDEEHLNERIQRERRAEDPAP